MMVQKTVLVFLFLGSLACSSLRASDSREDEWEHDERSSCSCESCTHESDLSNEEYEKNPRRDWRDNCVKIELTSEEYSRARDEVQKAITPDLQEINQEVADNLLKFETKQMKRENIRLNPYRAYWEGEKDPSLALMVKGLLISYGSTLVTNTNPEISSQTSLDQELKDLPSLQWYITNIENHSNSRIDLDFHLGPAWFKQEKDEPTKDMETLKRFHINKAIEAAMETEKYIIDRIKYELGYCGVKRIDNDTAQCVLGAHLGVTMIMAGYDSEFSRIRNLSMIALKNYLEHLRAPVDWLKESLIGFIEAPDLSQLSETKLYTLCCDLSRFYEELVDFIRKKEASAADNNKELELFTGKLNILEQHWLRFQDIKDINKEPMGMKELKEFHAVLISFKETLINFIEEKEKELSPYPLNEEGLKQWRNERLQDLLESNPQAKFYYRVLYKRDTDILEPFMNEKTQYQIKPEISRTFFLQRKPTTGLTTQEQ